MKKRTIKLSVADPCHEDWSGMLSNEQGRFCDSCAKVVVDFSNYSDTQILNYIAANKDQKTCGRFRPSQLERPIYYPKPPSEIHSFSLRAVLFGATLSSLLAAENSYGQETTSSPIRTEQPTDTSEVMMGQILVQIYNHSQERRVSGVILTADSDEKTTIVSTNVPVSLAKISIINENGDEIGKTVSNTDGSFMIDINWKKKPSYLKIEKEGMITQNHYFLYTAELQEMEIILIPGVELDVLGEMKIIEEKK
jgi:hypothetical protein